MKIPRPGLLAFAILAVCGTAQAQVLIAGTVYSQNFDSYAGSLVTLPTGWTVSATGTLTYRGTGTGSSASGGAWAYGSGNEFSLGSLASGTTGTITSAVSFTNNTGSTITSLTLSWNYEQWRYTSNSGLSVSGTGGLAGNSSLVTHGITGASIGTNGTATVTSSGSITLSSLSLSNGSTFGLNWATVAPSSGGYNGLAIDNFSLSATAIPEPSAYAAILGAIALAGMIIRRCGLQRRV